MMRVYIHGSGRSGCDAWPAVTSDDAIFADLASVPTVDAKVAEVSSIRPPGSVLVAHSAGAMPTVFAIDRSTASAEALVLLEPALYDIARGVPAVEAHIDLVTRARARAEAGDLYGFWQKIRRAMFGGPADAERWSPEEALAARFASIELPWGHSVTADMIGRVRTLVITGGWNAEYEAIAATLSAHGATHRQLVGNQHRPQDHADFAATVDGFLQA